ncbi:histidinol phosphate phosphatase [Helicobacter sp. 13S00401-1]|uniref:histidinol-phosphatase n=1 Tax=Helicobacter sp. 13S00401-1 TaxID=1905758 RepID=UPI000BA782B4|nr:histidinol-phosphatase [Helicobacter sp. 13S00401-1]PAF51777.1 histidinol phosphate phosphatase [Helicobacter sp. 13S00401-1]
MIDLHNHTIRCNHATGSIQEYIKAAKTQGIKYYGFSCHAPMSFDSKYRMAASELNDYLDDIKALKETTHDMDIKCGLEVDFILAKPELIQKEVLEANVDHLIGSVHFLDFWGFDNPEFLDEWDRRDVTECWKLYLASIKAMAETGYFQIAGHFDLLKVFGALPPKSLESKIYEALKAIKQNNMVLEINSAGLRKPIKESYPSVPILKMAKELDMDITFASDAHAVDQVGAGLKECIQLAKDLGFKSGVVFDKKIPFHVEL